MVTRIHARSGHLVGLYSRLPPGLRFLLDVGRIFGGLKGLWGLGGVATALIANGVVWGLLQAMPIGSRIAVLAGLTLLVFGLMGHFGAQVKRRSGNVRFLTDLELAQRLADLREDMAAYLMINSIVRQENTRASLYRQITGKEPDVDLSSLKGIKVRRGLSEMQGQGIALLREAVRRGFLSIDEFKEYAAAERLSELKTGLDRVSARIPRITGEVGPLLDA